MWSVIVSFILMAVLLFLIPVAIRANLRTRQSFSYQRYAVKCQYPSMFHDRG